MDSIMIDFECAKEQKLNSIDEKNISNSSICL